MDYEYNNNPIYGIVWFIIVGIIFYILCSLCSWSLSMDEWGLFSNDRLCHRIFDCKRGTTSTFRLS